MRYQVGDQDAREQTGDEQGQLQTRLFQALIEQHTDDRADMDGEDGIKKVEVADPLITLLLRHTHILGFDLLRLELVAGDQELGDRAAHQAGQDQSKGGAGDADLHRIADAEFLGDAGCPGNRGTVTADK